MAKLDENYLGAIRARLYKPSFAKVKTVPTTGNDIKNLGKNTHTVLKGHSKKTGKANQLHLSADNFCKRTASPSESLKPSSSSDIDEAQTRSPKVKLQKLVPVKRKGIKRVKNRVSTTSPSSLKVSTCNTVEAITDKISPSLSNGDTPDDDKYIVTISTDNDRIISKKRPKKVKKRSLSSDNDKKNSKKKSVNVNNSKKWRLLSCDDGIFSKIERSESLSLNSDFHQSFISSDNIAIKPVKHLTKMTNRAVDFSNGHSISNATEVHPSRKRKRSKNNRIEDITVSEPITIPEAAKSLKSKTKLKHDSGRNSPPVPENLADFYDDETVKVKGLKLKRFYNLFTHTHNDQLQSTTNTLQIPTKYFSCVQAEDEDSMNVKLDSPQNASDRSPSPTNAVDEEINSEIQTESPQNTSGSPPPSNAVDEEIDSEIERESSSEVEEMLEAGSEGVLQEPLLGNEEAVKVVPTTILTLKNYDKIIILGQLNEKVYFSGLCSLKVLNAEIEIMGAYFNKNSAKVKLYSPRGTSLLYLRNSYKLYADNNLMVKDLVPHHLLTEEQMGLSFKQHYAIALCQELKEPCINFLQSHIAQKLFPDNALLGAKVDFELLGNFNRTDSAKQWNSALKSVGLDTKVVICGGKGVGKSTFLRYSINRLLKQYGKVKVVDLDPGQSEFNPPGCVSVSTVEDYIMGPNYTHLQTPDISILTHINMDQNIQHYLKEVHMLVQSPEFSTNNLPTLVNFPGYTQGLGIDIAANILHLIEPTIVIEIKSKKQSKNYKEEVTAANINRILQTSILRDKSVNDNNLMNFRHVTLESLSEKNKAWSLDARQSREFCLLTYFGKMMSDNVRDLISPNVDMFSINVSEINIVNHQGKRISPLAVNGNIVALCSISVDDAEVFISYGYGYVRGMDLEQNVLVLLTPEPLERLQKADYLVLSSVTMPPSLIMSATNVKSQIPYLSSSELVEFAQLTKRSYVPPKK